MSKKRERKPRETKPLTPQQLQVPVDVSVIGTDDDPCFGKWYEPATEDCHACGDSEFCAIVHMYNMDKKRTKIEKKQKFKDTEPTVSKEPFMSSTQLNTIVEKICKKKGQVRFIQLRKHLQSKHDPDGLLPPDRISELLKYVVTHNKHLKKVKTKGKVYVRFIK